MVGITTKYKKKLKSKGPVCLLWHSVALIDRSDFGIWTIYGGWVGPSILIIGIALTIITATRQELEYEYIFVNGDCEISKIVKRSFRKKGV